LLFLGIEDFYCTWFNILKYYLIKPYIIGCIIYIIYLIKFNTKVTILEFVITLNLIFQVDVLLEIIFGINSLNNLDIQSVTGTDCVRCPCPYMNDNNNNIQIDNIPSNRENVDYTRLISDLGVSIAAFAIRRPLTRIGALIMGHTANTILDILNNEERANFWIDQYKNNRIHGRLLQYFVNGGQAGSGPFYLNPKLNPNNASLGDSFASKTDINSNITKFIGDSDSDLFRDLISPVEHSIPLSTLVNVHTIFILGLFVIVLIIIILMLYFYLNLFILSNKDYLLNNVKNKYLLMYVKYVLFKTRIDIILIGAFILTGILFVAYILHYLVIHPIILG
jgi:hypothetical protein